MVQISELDNHVYTLRPAEGEDWLFNVHKQPGPEDSPEYGAIRDFIEKNHHTESILLLDLSQTQGLYAVDTLDTDDPRPGRSTAKFLHRLNAELQEAGISCIGYGLEKSLQDHLESDSRHTKPGLTFVDTFEQARKFAQLLQNQPTVKGEWKSSAEPGRYANSLLQPGTKMVLEEADGGFYLITIEQDRIGDDDLPQIQRTTRTITQTVGRQESGKTVIIDLSDVRLADPGLDTTMAEIARHMKQHGNSLRLVCSGGLAQQLRLCKTAGARVYDSLEKAESADLSQRRPGIG